MIKNKLKKFSFFLKYLKPYWKKEILVWFLNLITVSLPLINPYLTKLVIDKAYTEKDLKLFIKILIFAGLIFLVSNLLNALLQYFSEYIKMRVRFDLQRKIFHNIGILPYNFFQNRSSGEYLYNLINDSAQTTTLLTVFLPELFYLIPKFLLLSAIIFIFNWKMAIFIFLLISFIYIPPFFITRQLSKKSEKLLESSQDILETTRETFSNMQLVKVFGKEKTEFKRYVRGLINNIRINVASIRLNMLSSFMDSGVNKLIFGLLTFYGGYSIINGQMTLGSFTALMLYINQFLGLQSYLASLFTSFNVGYISARRLSGILDSWPKDTVDKETRDFLFVSGKIQFKNVTFGYYSDNPVLRDLNFKIEAGTKIGLVGHSGVGKTTLVNLIVKLYLINTGQIFIDNKDITLIKNSSLRKQIGVVLQKPFLWNDTIRNNILYGYPHASSKEVLRASRISCAYDFIRDLPQGFDTVIGEAGLRLSEGQKQRLAIARAVIKNPKILIIDEGMSSLDSETEDNIVHNLKCEFEPTTIIFISHRLSTIKKMDLVYFLEGANVINIGLHEQLVKEKAKYRELFASQLQMEKEKISFSSYTNDQI